MFSYSNINQELIDFHKYENELEAYNKLLNGGATQRERYYYKVLDKADFDFSKNLLGIKGNYKYKLSEFNPLLPDISNKDKENVLFLTTDNISNYNIGFTVVGKFRDTVEKNQPDTIDIFLSKINEDKTVTAWRRLNDDFPGLNKIYNGRESTKYITKNMYVSGKTKYDKSSGDTLTSTNAYNITTIIRTLLSKEESSKKIKDMIERINNNDYSILDFKAIHNSSEAYHTSLNTLANGNLENLIFESSGVKDMNISSPTTKVGERFLIKKKLNVDVFTGTFDQFKTSSTGNKREFIKFIKMLDYEEIKKTNTEAILDFKNKLIDFSKKSFEENIDMVSNYKKIIKEKMEDEKNKFTKIKVGDLLKEKNNFEDYLNQTDEVKKRLKKYFGEDKNIYEKYIEYDKALEILDSVDKKYKPYIEKMKKAMNNVIYDRAKTLDLKKYIAISNMSNNFGDNQKNNFEMIKKQITSDFFNSYNEKYDLFSMLMMRRQNMYVSEAELISSLVKPIYEGNKKIGYEVNKKREYNTELVDINEKEIEFRYGFYKAKKQYGKEFDNLSFEEQKKVVNEYTEKYSNLIKKAKTKTTLGKYDSVNNFIKAREALKPNRDKNDNMYMELLSGDNVATTYDKVISNLNKDMSLDVTFGTYEKIKKDKSGFLRFNIKFTKDDGFEANDLIKDILATNIGELRESSYHNQRYIQDRFDLIKHNNTVQEVIREGVRKKIIDSDFARHMLSYLKGNNQKNKAYFGIDKNKNLVYIRDNQHYKSEGIKKLTNYSDVYNGIIKFLKSKNFTQVLGMEDKNNSMKSVRDLFNEAYEKDKNITNSLFLNILNRDDIVNFAGGGIQSSFVRGNSSLMNFGYTSPGVAFNKMTQRTFQSKDLLGEKTINVNGVEKQISVINAEVLSKLNVGISLRKGKYVTEELLKDTINLMKNKYGINNKDYVRGDVFKTFAIGDFNQVISKDYTIDSYTASFQEGMTGSMALKNTTNAIRTKIININLDEINFEAMNISREEFEKMLINKEKIGEAVENIIDEKLYKTIKGNKKLSAFYEELETINKSDSIDAKSFYKDLVSIANKQIDKKENKFKISKNITEKEAKIKIMDILEDIKFKVGAVALPTTSQGKNIITKKEFVNKAIEVKPEVGLSISNLTYDKQRKSIEILLENTASSDQGSKNQAIGAKNTISAIYDLLEIRSSNGDKYSVAGIFNNKTEKRAQTGMFVHGSIQTIFANSYEKFGLKGVEKLRDNIKDLLKDLEVEVYVDKDKDTYFIDETYLTRDFNGKKITAEQFEDFLTTEGLGNTNKLFTDRGKEIINKVSKKYGSEYINKDGEFFDENLAHLGIVMEANRGYIKTFRDFGENKITPFVIDNAEGIAEYNGKESILGKGSVLLLKLTTERVNSNASKKKESATKIGKEMMYMMKIGGYSPLVDYMRNKRKDRVVEALNDTFKIINVNSYINKIYDREGFVDTDKLVTTLENNLDNSIVLNISDLTKDDYLLNSTDLYKYHRKLMDNSILGTKIKEKGLDELNKANNRLSKPINVIIKDDTISSFYDELRVSIKNVINSIDDEKNINIKKTLESFYDSSNLNMKNVSDLIKNKQRIESVIFKNKSISSKKDAEYIRKFLNIVENNMEDKFALDTLKTIMKTGKMVSVVNLNYDIHEIDGTIVNSEELNKIVSIANNHNKYTGISNEAIKMLNKYDEKDTSLIDDVITGVKSNINNYTIDNSNVYTKIFNEINNDYLKEKHTDTYKLVEDIAIFNSESNKFKAERKAINDMLNKYGKNLKETPEEILNFLEEKEVYFQEYKNNLDLEKSRIINELDNGEHKKIIAGRLNNLLFGNYKNSNEKTKESIVKLRNIITTEAKEQVNTMFSSLNEYLKMPSEVSNFTKKGSRVYEALKYNVKSSMVVNPIEGSGVLEEFKQITFDGVKSVKDIRNNLDELKMLLTGKIVNENLFIDDGVNYLDELESKFYGTKGFEEGLEKAKKVFGKKLAGINGVTVMDKNFTKAFRNKDYVVNDIFEDTTKGIVKELTFFSRYPQQTAQHFGPILNISLDRNEVDNKYAKAILPYLSKEKNQAGVVTLGKKTMLTVRGDHDGDKTYLTFLDFLDNDIELKQKTTNQLFVDFQLKNNNLSNFVVVDKETFNVNSIKGNVFEFENSISMDKKQIDLSYRNLEESYELLNDNLGINKTDLYMKYKYFEDLDFRIGMRAYKELGKHNNSSYELIAKLTDVVPYIENYNEKDIEMIENVLNKLNKDLDRNKKYTGRHLRHTDDFVNYLKIAKKEGQFNALKKVYGNNKEFNSLKTADEYDNFIRSSVFKMDTTSSSVFFSFFKDKPETEEELYKNTLKEIKNIDRGNFTKINVKNTKAIYDELTGIKNTGKTHAYASSIRNTSTEISELDPTSIINNLGRFVKGNMSIEELSKIKNMQKYFGYGIDSTVDNMIESAISAKHGLTLGGLEGTKIFTDLLLSPTSENLNNKIIDLFENYVIKNDRKTKIDTMKKLASFSKTVSTINASFEDAYAEVDKQGLDKSIFQLVINNKKTLKSRHLTKEQASKYSEIRDKFLGENFELEKKLAEEFKKNKYIDRTEYQIFEGLTRVGDMLIQNEPGTEFDPDKVLSLISELENNNITYEKFLTSHDIKLIESQLFSSLGSSASISAIGNTRKYTEAFVEKRGFDKAINYLKENLSHDSYLLKDTTKDLSEHFDNDLKVKGKVKVLAIDEREIRKAKAIRDEYIKNMNSKAITNPVAYFTEIINSTNSIFSNTAKDIKTTSNILNDIQKGMGFSLNNNNSFDVAIKKAINENGIFNRKIVADYFGDNYELIDDVFVDNTHSANFLNLLHRMLDSEFIDKKSSIIKKMSNEEFKKSDDVVGVFINRTLNEYDKKLFDSNRLIEVKQKNITDFLSTISDKQKYYLDDVLFFYNNGSISYEIVDEIKNLYLNNDNIYLSDKMIKKLMELSDDFRKDIIPPEEENRITKDVINAYKYLGEELTVENLRNRIKNKFDYKLATKIQIDKFKKENSDLLKMMTEKNQNDYLKRMEKNLSTILIDFSNIEKIDNNYYIDDSYIKLAHMFTSKGTNYISPLKYSNDKKIYNKLIKNREIIENFINDNLDILKEIKNESSEFNEELFKKYSMLSMMNNDISFEFNRNKNIIRNSLKEVIGNDELFGKISNSIIDPKVINDKNKIKITKGALFGTTAMLIGKKVIQYITNSNKQYIVSEGTNSLSEEELLNNLNIGNGHSTNSYTQELLDNKSIPKYITINKKHF